MYEEEVAWLTHFSFAEYLRSETKEEGEGKGNGKGKSNSEEKQTCGEHKHFPAPSILQCGGGATLVEVGFDKQRRVCKLGYTVPVPSVYCESAPPEEERELFICVGVSNGCIITGYISPWPKNKASYEVAAANVDPDAPYYVDDVQWLNCMV